MFFSGQILRNSFFYISLILLAVFFSSTGAQELNDPVLRLDPIEKALVDDSKIPIQKVQMLQNADISLIEYFEYPWLKLGITEKEWIRQQRAGILTNDTIISTKQVKKTEWAVVQNFFLPGLHQFKRSQLTKGFIMSGVALGALSLFAFHKKDKTDDIFAFDYPIYIAFLGTDLLWSSIDIGVQINKDLNHDSMRFSYQISIPLTLPLNI